LPTSTAHLGALAGPTPFTLQITVDETIIDPDQSTGSCFKLEQAEQASELQRSHPLKFRVRLWMVNGRLKFIAAGVKAFGQSLNSFRKRGCVFVLMAKPAEFGAYEQIELGRWRRR
jgi:hypothetical protein